MRADAKKNYEQVLEVARATTREHGANASLRDIARRANVGLGTLYRHFPTREALLEALLRNSFDSLAERAADLQQSASPGDALLAWSRECVACAHEFRGAITLMSAAIEDPDSALHGSCVAMRAAGGELLHRAQTAGVARADLDGVDLFAIVAALAWLKDQATEPQRADRLIDLLVGALLH